MKFRPSFLFAFLFLTAVACASENVLIVHEWGTFTALQNDQGKALGGLNADSEPLPRFVYSIGSGEFSYLSKGVNYIHPEVSMRLETPVVYFHPPANIQHPITVDFRAQFNGGWLTQYYPNAEAVAPGLQGAKENLSSHLTLQTKGTLFWKGLRIGAEGPLPQTKESVWLAPRQVDAATVVNSQGQAEKYLFYRGLGNLDAPLKITRTGDTLGIEAQVPAALAGAAKLDIPTLWLVHIRPDKSCAFRAITPSHPDLRNWSTVATPATFSEGEYGAENLSALKAALRVALLADGLYADESDALLNTWDHAYFKQHGLRLFFLVPHAWTDHVLPIAVSADSSIDRTAISRTMVGRIELISPEQREALKVLAATSPDKLHSVYNEILKLGRFQTALLWNQRDTLPSPNTQAAVNAYGPAVYVLK